MENEKNQVTTRNAYIIASEINYIKERTKRQVLSASMEIGAKLIEAKGLVPFGEWEKWLADNVNYSQSTANNLMRIYKEYGDTQVNLLTGKAPAEVFGALTYTQAVVLLGLPMDERMAIVTENNVEDMSSRELEKEVAARRAAEDRANTLAETLDAERSASDELKSTVESLREELCRMTLAAEAPEQIDMSDYISRSDADNERIAAVEAARKESVAALDKAKADADKANKKANSLEEKLKNASSDAAEAAKAEYSAALSAAQAKNRELEAKLDAAASPAVQRFAIYFEQLKTAFDKLCSCIDEASEDERPRLRGGIVKVINAMTAAVEE